MMKRLRNNLKINELEEGLNKLTDDWRKKKVSEGIEYLKQALEEVSEKSNIQKDFTIYKLNRLRGH